MTDDDARIAHRHSDTAEATAAMRVVETLFFVKFWLFDDLVARELVCRPAYRLPARFGPIARLTVFAFERRCPGLHGHVVLRSRYADDAIARSGTEQIVMLGAGFDATAFRLDEAATLFDVDVLTTQGIKRERLAGRMPLMPVTYTSCRFGVDDLSDRLRESGFDDGAPTLFVWLGVVPYLSTEAFEATMADVRKLSAPGSRLVLDYVESSVLDGTTTHPGGRRIAHMVAKRGEPLRTGFTPGTLREALAPYGFVVEDDAGLADLAARYPAAGGPRYTSDGFNRIATATAEK
jgi:methyltransferase (TIGR00027 family)